MISANTEALPGGEVHRFYAVKQAATYLGMSAATVQKYSDLGELACRRVGKNRMFRKEDLDFFIDSRPRWVGEERGGTGGNAGSFRVNPTPCWKD